MPVEVLVMCRECGRPQFEGPLDCVACGAKLPEVPAPAAPRSARDALLAEYEPFMEADLGAGRALLLSPKHLEIRPKSGRPTQVELGKLASVALVSRPVWESLVFAAASGVGSALAPRVLVRVSLLGVALLAVAACFLQKRYALVLTLKEGVSAQLPLGMGREGTPAVQRIRSVWRSVREELRGLGVDTGSSA